MMRKSPVALMLLFCAPACRAAPMQERVVAAVIAAEATSEGPRGMRAVAEVISIRSAEKRMTPLAVVTRRKWFTSLNHTAPAQLVQRWEIEPGYADALGLAAAICRSPGRIEGITNGATHFTRAGERPYWTRHLKPLAVIGRLAFYRAAY
jgi:Cell Wall Hydrolase